MYKRIKIAGTAFLVIIGLLVLRVAYIQVLGHEDLSVAAKLQQNIVLEGADTRGVIYDRNGAPIAGGHRDYIYILKSENYDGETQNALDSVEAEEVVNGDNGYRVFVSQEYDKKTGERLINNSGAYVLEAGRRYQSSQPAVHMVGYVNPGDGRGASGLELMYDEELQMLNKKVSAVADVNGNLMHGYGLNVESAADNDTYVKEGITTTLDLGLQKEVERILADCENPAALVVLKSDSGEILAAAGTPVYDPTRIEEYMDSNNGELINKVTQGTYPPGSVFKIIVAAAALEAGVSPDKKLKCTGKESVNGHSVKCETGGENGHGVITFEQAFADSCNSAFIQLGQLVGAEAVIEMAERFGLGKTVLEDFPEEHQGNIMTLLESEGAAIANLAIGQGETLVTPLQVAAMTTIVANNGKKIQVKITSTETSEWVECISPKTAAALQEMMKAVMDSGTGSGLELPVSAGAKTGSAESVQGGTEVVHGWITGYIPADNPQYVITAFVENGRSGRGSAGPLFSRTAEYITEQGLLEYETDF